MMMRRFFGHIFFCRRFSVTQTDSTDTTLLLNLFSNGDAEAAEVLIPMVYRELRQIAERYMSHERPDHTLQPTALVHEVYMRLFEKKIEYSNRGHFLAVASQMMRRLLIDHSRRLHSDRRQGDRQKLSLDEIPEPTTMQPELVIDLHDALSGFAKLHPRASRVVEMRFFGGFQLDEIAAALDVSLATVKRDWDFAQVWLVGQLTD